MRSAPALLVPTLIKPGESIPGLISRATNLNHYTSSFVIWNLLPKPAAIHSNGWTLSALTGHVHLDRLALLTGNTSKALRAACVPNLRPSPGCLTDSFLVTQYWRICPECDKAGLGHQRCFTLAFVTACPTHGCQLIDTCGHCRSPLISSQTLRGVCVTCQQPFSVTRAASRISLSCSKAVASALEGYDSGESAALEQLLNRLMAATYLSSSCSFRTRHRYTLHRLLVAEMDAHLERIWPWAMSEAALSLTMARQERAFRNRWAFLPGASGLMRDRLLQLTGTHIPSSIDDGQAFDWDVNDAWELPTSWAARAAGVSATNLVKLVDRGLIPARMVSAAEGNKNFGTTRMISLDAINQFVAKAHTRAAPKIDADSSMGGLTPIIRLGIDDILVRAIHDEIPLYFSSPPGLSSLFAPYSWSTSGRKRAYRPKDTLTIKEARSTLGTSRYVIDRLLDLGYLTHANESLGIRKLITRESARRFDKSFIAVDALAKQWAVNSTNLGEKLGTLGIRRVPGPSIEDGGVTMYRRSDLAGISAQDIRNITRYKAKTGRKWVVRIAGGASPRLRKLVSLCQAAGSPTEFAKQSSISTGYISSLMTGHKPFGDLAARNLEKRLGRPEGWLDR